MGRIQTYGSVKPRESEIKPFVDCIREKIEELDWAMQCYSITLKETGMNDRQVEDKLREVFFQIAREVVKP